MNLARLVFGDPLKTENLASERLSKVKALAIFASDVLSSVAYATESILLTLGAVLAASLSLPIAASIVVLLTIVICSYWQTIKAYPNGGGAFDVSYRNLGEFFGLFSASALLIDYSLTVAVSLSEGAHAIISAFPSCASFVLPICLGVLAVITISNLRGAQESATFLSIPTYCFIGIMLLLVFCGIFVSAPQQNMTIPRMPAQVTNFATVLVILRAFSSGCSALTGIEAIASGVPSFKKPQSRNAQITLVIMGMILSILFFGITFLAHKFGIEPNGSETVLSQVAKKVFGTGFFYYAVQFFTACILFLAANTSFAGFPRLASVLAKAQYIPTRFANLGDRLAFSNGIVALASVAFILIVLFGGDTHALLPLYALGVFISFTLSQTGMVKHLIREKPENWPIKVAISSIGALATFFTLLIIVESKFSQGAWIVMIIIPVLFTMFKKVNKKYRSTNTELDLSNGGLTNLLKPLKEIRPKVVVPVSRIHKGTLAALRFAASLSNDVVAVVVNVNQKDVDRLKLSWRAINFNIPLVILDSPYRSIVNPFLDFLFEQDNRDPFRGKAIVVMPSFVTGMEQNVLHNQTVSIFKKALLNHRSRDEQMRVIVEIPYQIQK